MADSTAMDWTKHQNSAARAARLAIFDRPFWRSGWALLLLVCLSMIAGVMAGYQLGLNENPGRVLSRDVERMYTEALRAK